MNPTATLIDIALKRRTQADWAREMNVDPSALAQAKRRQHASPEIAGYLAEALGLDPDKWIAIAGLEQSKESPIKTRMLKRLTADVMRALKSLLSSIKRRRKH